MRARLCACMQPLSIQPLHMCIEPSYSLYDTAFIYTASIYTASIYAASIYAASIYAASIYTASIYAASAHYSTLRRMHARGEGGQAGGGSGQPMEI
jgi:hypothetical protein